MNLLSNLIRHEQIDEDFDLLDAVNELSKGIGWNQIVLEAMSLLEERSQVDYWERSIAICFWAVSRVEDPPLPRMKWVARLYWCLVNFPDSLTAELGDIDNLVWSIAKHLKGVSYNSDWDPMRDSEVQMYMSEMK